MTHRSAVNAGEMPHGPNIEGVDWTLMWHGYAHIYGEMVGIMRMNVPEKMPKTVVINQHTILINTDSYINVSM